MENQRKCISCGEIKPRNNMIRVMKNFQTGELVVNPNSKTFGRSVYLCYNQNCIEQALKKKKINRVLKINADMDLKGILDGQLKS